MFQFQLKDLVATADAHYTQNSRDEKYIELEDRISKMKPDNIYYFVIHAQSVNLPRFAHLIGKTKDARRISLFNRKYFKTKK